jgi:hypothetical protein
MVSTRRSSRQQNKEKKDFPSQSAFSNQSSSTAATTRKSQVDGRGLSNSIQKQLIHDIQSRGGIKNCGSLFQIKDICNSKPDIYGPSGTLLRKKVRSRVQYLAKLSDQEYRILVNRFIAEYNPASLFSGQPPPSLSSPSLTASSSHSSRIRSSSNLSRSSSHSLSSDSSSSSSTTSPEPSSRLSRAAVAHSYRPLRLFSSPAAARHTSGGAAKMSSIGSDQPSMSSAARLFDSLTEDQYGKILLVKEESYFN